MPHATQILIVLDVESLPSFDEITACMPDERDDRIVIRYSESGGPSVTRRGDTASPVNWDGLAAGISALVTRVRSAISKARTTVQLFIVGRAPLPAFVQLGFELSAWSEPQTILNRRKDGNWDILRVGTGGVSSSERFFNGRTGIPLTETSQATGRVVVFASTVGMPEAPKDALREMTRASGDNVAGLVELVTSDSGVLDQTTASVAAQELAEAMSQIPGSYPFTSGLAVAVAGPATLAFLTGRAVNQNIHPTITVAEYEASKYRVVLDLPWRSRTPTLSVTADAVAGRSAALRTASSAVENLRSTLTSGDFSGLLSTADADAMILRLRGLVFDGASDADAFQLSVLQNRVSLGNGLLEVLRQLPEDDQIRIAELLLVHEIHHFDQSIQSSDYMEIGRAGVALEEVDFWADAFSVQVLARWRQRTAEATEASFRQVLVNYLDALILGLRSFDRAEQGDRIIRLSERRLRRYLIWHLQRARAATTRTAEDMQAMFRTRLIAELAPLRGSLDVRWDKVVEHALHNTELVVVFNAVLARFHRQPGFEPESLVEALRRFDEQSVRTAMEFVVGKWHDHLAPWAAQKLPLTV